MLALMKSLAKTQAPLVLNAYRYDFVTSGFDRVNRVRFLIEGQKEWDYCYSRNMQKLNNFKSAEQFGYGPRFTEEEAALGQMLIKLNAGPHIMTYAWGLYADVIKSETKSH